MEIKSSNLSTKQQEVSSKIKNIYSKYSKQYIAISSAAGSGKTTTLLSGLENFFSETTLIRDTFKNIKGEDTFFLKNYTSDNIKEEFPLSDLSNPNQSKKVLILAFGKNAIDDFIKKADRINVKSIIEVNDENGKYFIEKETKLSLLIEASTYHSLLLRIAKPIVEKLGYTPDYSKSNFFKKDINFVVDKYNLKIKKDVVEKISKFIDEYHNSPKDFISFIKHQNIVSNGKNIMSLDEAKLIKFIIDKIYEEMENHTITMPHCFYYKTIHQLASNNSNFLNSIFRDKTGKPFDLILVDEAQDSDEIIYDLIKRSNKKAIFVGDTFQNIYGFRGTYNVFEDLFKEGKENTDFFKLDESFRYGKAISSLTSAMPLILGHTSKDMLETIGKKEDDYIHTESLNIKNVSKYCTNVITTNDNAKRTKKESMNQVAIICRSNKRAFEIYAELKDSPILASHVKIESGLKSKTKEFIDKGMHAIEDTALREQIRSILQLEEFSFEDMINNQDVCDVLSTTEYSYLLKCKDEVLKKAMIQKSSGYEAVTIITVHGSKGLEYEKVIIADDYIKDDNSNINYLADSDFSTAPKGLNNETINIIYTAATRAKESLFFMESNLFSILKDDIKHASQFNSQKFIKDNTYLINATVIKIDEKKQKEENKKNIIEDNLLFSPN